MGYSGYSAQASAGGLVQMEAAAAGYSQNLWLMGADHQARGPPAVSSDTRQRAAADHCYAHAHAPARTRTRTHAHTHARAHARARARTHAHARTHTHAHARTHARARMYV